MSRLKTDAIRNVNASVDGITLDTSGNVAIPNELQLAEKIVHTGDTNTLIRFPSADTVSVETGGGERLRIDSSGHVMIGTTTEGFATYGDQFTIANSGHCGMTIRSGSSNYGTIYFSDGDDGSADEVRGFVEYNHSDNQLSLGSNGSARLRIKSGGTVAIPAQGSSNANPRLLFESAVDANDFSFSQYEDGNGTYTLIGQNLQLNSGGNTTVLDSGHKTAGLLFDGRNNGSLIFYTGGTNAQSERLRITSAGKIHSLNAVQSGGNTTGGFQFDAVDTACVLGIQQPSSASDANAAIQVFDGTSNNLRINYSGLIKTSEGIDFSGAQTNNAGMTSETLDSYEEGTFTPVWAGLTTAGTVNYGQNMARYTKSGNTVHCNGYTQISSASSAAGHWVLNNLPFTNTGLGTTSPYETGSCMLNNFDFPAAMDDASAWVVTYKPANNTYMYLYYSIDAGAWAPLNAGNDTTWDIIWSLSYKVG